MSAFAPLSFSFWFVMLFSVSSEPARGLEIVMKWL
jgi:hypothetical protein